MDEIKGVIFDLDGTLIDSMGVWEKIDNDFLDKRGILPPSDIGSIIKNMTFRETAFYFKERFSLPELPDAIMEEWNRMAYLEYANNIGLKAGAMQYLNILKVHNKKIAIATNTGKDLLNAVLKNNGIEGYFDAIVIVDEVKRGKEFPDIFLLAVAKLGLLPHECIVYEDILPAVKSAKSVGMKAIGVYDKYSEFEREEIQRIADDYIFSFEEII